MTQKLFEGHVPLLRPWIEEEEIQAVAEILRTGWISQGPRVAEFESAIASYVGAKQGIATNACTSALHLAISLSDVGPGDEVICPSFTCMATANAIHHAGAQPVFAEIDARTYDLDPSKLEAALTPRTRAILVVHQIGLPADVDAIYAVANRHHLRVIEDGACSLGATYKGRRVGGLGSPTCFSFHPRKMITTGEGGMITTDDPRLAERARMLRATGASISDLERHKAKGVLVQTYSSVGYNYRMTDMQAAIGLVQLGRLPDMLEQRSAQAKRYDAALAAIDEIESPYVPEYCTHAYSSYLVRLRHGCPVTQVEMLRGMAERGISCRIGIQPLHKEPYYLEQMGNISLPTTEEASRNTIFLPIFPGMTEAEQERVIGALTDVLTKPAF